MQHNGFRPLPYMNNKVWIPAVEFWKDSARVEQFHRLIGGLAYDPLKQGYFLNRSSPEHTLAILLGFRIYDNFND